MVSTRGTHGVSESGSGRTHARIGGAGARAGAGPGLRCDSATRSCRAPGPCGALLVTRVGAPTSGKKPGSHQIRFHPVLHGHVSCVALPTPSRHRSLLPQGPIDSPTILNFADACPLLARIRRSVRATFQTPPPPPLTSRTPEPSSSETPPSPPFKSCAPAPYPPPRSNLPPSTSTPLATAPRTPARSCARARLHGPRASDAERHPAPGPLGHQACQDGGARRAWRRPRHRKLPCILYVRGSTLLTTDLRQGREHGPPSTLFPGPHARACAQARAALVTRARRRHPDFAASPRPNACKQPPDAAP